MSEAAAVFPLPVKEKKPKLRRVITVNDLINKKRVTLPFEGAWKDGMGCPQSNAVIFIWGKSNNGKTRFIVQFIKYLCNHIEKILLDSLEEGDSESLAQAFRQEDMHEVHGKVFILDNEPLDQLMIRLKKKKQAQAVVIDSWQYARKDYAFYQQMKEKFKNKMFIINSHAQGNNPKGASADEIRYDAMIKIHVVGFVAKIGSRFPSPRLPYVIWEDGAKRYWGKKYKDVINGKYWPGQK